MLDLSRIWRELTHDRVLSDAIQAFLHALGCPLTACTHRLLLGVEAGGMGEFNIAVVERGLRQVVRHFLLDWLQRGQLADFSQP